MEKSQFDSLYIPTKAGQDARMQFGVRGRCSHLIGWNPR